MDILLHVTKATKGSNGTIAHMEHVSDRIIGQQRLCSGFYHFLNISDEGKKKTLVIKVEEV